jgi:hypothetical protein
MDLLKLAMVRCWRGVIRQATEAERSGAGVSDSG